MIPWVIGAAVAAVAAKVANEAESESVDASKDFAELTRDEKNQAIKVLREKGIPQAKIAECFGISAPAVSQRLKRLEERPRSDMASNANSFDGLSKVASLYDAGFSDNAIAALFQDSDIEITAQDISSFRKVYYATLKLTQ
ncbi:winged helix-turn-helix domain-containing protein [Vibrio alginolyticus]|uniref:helix-turn-helix transcriptional regulator n=1 Tax=Vibrio alginolyticus TaxID=663 RepID=UPI002FEF765A